MIKQDTLAIAAPRHGGRSKYKAAPHFTPAERTARGRAERAEVPRTQA